MRFWNLSLLILRPRPRGEAQANRIRVPQSPPDSDDYTRTPRPTNPHVRGDRLRCRCWPKT